EVLGELLRELVEKRQPRHALRVGPRAAQPAREARAAGARQGNSHDARLGDRGADLPERRLDNPRREPQPHTASLAQRATRLERPSDRKHACGQDEQVLKTTAKMRRAGRQRIALPPSLYVQPLYCQTARTPKTNQPRRRVVRAALRRAVAPRRVVFFARR